MSGFVIVGKCPPLQGGTANQTLWLALEIVRQGHDVVLVTTSSADAAPYRAVFRDDEWSAATRLVPGIDRIRRVELDEASFPQSIPAGSARLTRLASCAIDAAEEIDACAVIGVYLEPYAMAAAFAARARRLPLALMHAGSDVTRLCALRDRRAAYQDVLASADLVLSARPALPLLADLGVDATAVRIGRPALDPPEVFDALGSKLDLDEFASLARAKGFAVFGQAPTETATVLGSYGKWGRTKGSFELIEATRRLADSGEDVHLVMVGPMGDRTSEDLARLALSYDLESKVLLLPFLPPWRMGELLRRLDVACCLENHFPVTIHRPAVVREAMACGTRLVLSAELLDVQRTAEELRRCSSVVCVQDPTRPAELASSLQSAMRLADPDVLPVSSGPSGSVRDGWVASLVSELQLTREARDEEARVLTQLQSALLALVCEPGSDLGAVSRPQQSDSGQAVVDVIARLLEDEEGLARYRRAVRAKRLALLLRSIPSLSVLVDDERDRLEREFLSQWPLLRRTEADERLAFCEFALQTLTASGALSDSSASTLAGAAARFALDVVPPSAQQVSSDELSVALSQHAAVFVSSAASAVAVRPSMQDHDDVVVHTVAFGVATVLSECREPRSHVEFVARMAETLGTDEQTALRATQRLVDLRVLEMIGG